MVILAADTHTHALILIVHVLLKHRILFTVI